MSTTQLVLPLHDDIIHVPSRIYRTVGQYRTRVFIGPKKTVLLLSEVGFNAGPSVTNAMGDVVAAACGHYCLDDRSITVVEHYDHRGAGGGRTGGGQETFSHVVAPSLRYPGHAYATPEWKHVEKTTVEGWIGGALP